MFSIVLEDIHAFYTFSVNVLYHCLVWLVSKTALLELVAIIYPQASNDDDGLSFSFDDDVLYMRFVCEAREIQNVYSIEKVSFYFFIVVHLFFVCLSPTDDEDGDQNSF